MNDLLTGLGIAMVLEGLLWAAATDHARKIVLDLVQMPDSTLKPVGWTIVAAGVGLVWLIRG